MSSADYLLQAGNQHRLAYDLITKLAQERSNLPLSTDESRQNAFVSRKESFLPTISSPKRTQATEAFAPSRQEPRNRTFVPVQTTAPREPTFGQAVWPLYDDWKDESTKQCTPVLRQQKYKELLSDTGKEVFSKHWNQTKPYAGECGPQTYSPKHMSNYYVVRSLVDNLVSDILKKNIPIPTLPDIHVQQSLMISSKLNRPVIDERLIQLLMEEIFFEVTNAMCEEISVGLINLYRVVCDDRDFMSIIQEASGFKASKSTDIQKTIQQDIRQQKHTRKSIHECWKQSQSLSYQDSKNRLTLPHELTAVIDRWSSHPLSDITVLDFNAIVPLPLFCSTIYGISETDSYLTRINKSRLIDYRLAEGLYWHSLCFDICPSLQITKQCRGITVAQASFTQRYLALCTIQGSIVVVDFALTPPQCTNVEVTSDETDPIVDIAWHNDSSKFVTITEKGLLTVWSMQPNKYTIDNQNSVDLYIPPELDRKPDTLRELVRLDYTIRDFNFSAGPLSMTGALDDDSANHKPLRATFLYPLSLTLNEQEDDMWQESEKDNNSNRHSDLYVALANHDVFNCDISGEIESIASHEQRQLQSRLGDSSHLSFQEVQKNLPQSPVQAHLNANCIAHDIPVALFRSHEHPIVHIGFVHDDLITVDNAGFINIWKYANEQRCESGWFVPAQRFSIEMVEHSFQKTDRPPHIIFTDHESEYIDEERREAEGHIPSSLVDTDLFHWLFFDDQDLVTRMYISHWSVADGAVDHVMHVISRNIHTNELRTYLTQLYHPVEVQCSRLLICQQSSTGEHLVVLLLFPQVTPKEAHVTAVVVNLFDMFPMFREDIELSDEILYNRCLRDDIVSCTLTPASRLTGSVYLFVCIDGVVSGYSVTSHQKILVIDDTLPPFMFGFEGCFIDRRELNVAHGSKLAVSCYDRFIYLVLYDSITTSTSQHSNPVTIIKMSDVDSDTQLGAAQIAFQKWTGLSPLVCGHVADFNDDSSSFAFIRRLLQSVVDDILRH